MPLAGKLEVELKTEKFVQAVKRIGPSIGPSFGTATGIKLSIILQEGGGAEDKHEIYEDYCRTTANANRKVQQNKQKTGATEKSP